MKRQLLLSLLLLSAGMVIAQQTKLKRRADFPLVAGIQFHSVSLPFKDVTSVFQNVGFRLGTEIRLNGKATWLQTLTLGWAHAESTGNTLTLYTASAYRPAVIGGLYAEIKGGLGIMKAFHPSRTYRMEDGEWVNKGMIAKTMLMVPLAVGLGYDTHLKGMSISPFVNYELQAAIDYNRILPVLPNSVFTFGSRIHF